MGVLQLQTSVPSLVYANGRADSKAAILSVLTREWPLSAKEIYFRIRQNNGNSITYQGIHKAVMQLTSEGVLSKANSKYALNSEWITKVRKFGEEMESAFSGRRCVHLKEIGEKSSIQLVFNSLLDFFYWMVNELAESNAASPEGIYSVASHPWPITHLSKPQFLKLKETISSCEHYFAFRGNSQLDKALSAIWRKVGCKVRLNAKCDRNCDTLAYRDYVIQLFIPKEMKRDLGRAFGSHLTISSVSCLYDSYFKTSEPVNVLISRNPILSEQLKEEVLQAFK